MPSKLHGGKRRPSYSNMDSNHRVSGNSPNVSSPTRRLEPCAPWINTLNGDTEICLCIPILVSQRKPGSQKDWCCSCDLNTLRSNGRLELSTKRPCYDYFCTYFPKTLCRYFPRGGLAQCAAHPNCTTVRRNHPWTVALFTPSTSPSSTQNPPSLESQKKMMVMKL